MTGPAPAGERLRRLLIVLPWLMERGQATVAEAAARFGVSEKQLIADLELAALCGLPPYVDELIDVFIDDGVITVGIPRLFTRPLQLTAREGFALQAAGRAAMALPGADPGGSLGRALEKLDRALGRPVLRVDVPPAPFLDEVREAAETGTVLQLGYWSAHRADRTEREVEPLAVAADRGRWYLRARDRSVGGDERWFRVDRIEAVTATGERFEPVVTGAVAPDWSEEFADATLVTLRVPVEGRWAAERYPVTGVRDDGPDHLLIDLPVTTVRWLERLLLRLGPGATVVAPAHLVDTGRAAAARVLSRYRPAPSG